MKLGRSHGNLVCADCRTYLEEGDQILWGRIGDGAKCYRCTTDVERLMAYLEAAGEDGVHTFDLRAKGLGNPSQRANDAEAKYGVTILRPTEMRNGRRGARFMLVGSSTEGRGQAKPRSYSPAIATPSVASGEVSAGVLSSEPVPAEPARLFDVPPTMYDPFSEAA